MSRRGVRSSKPKAHGVSLPLEMWPETDRLLWARARNVGSVLEDGGFGRNWAVPTAAKYTSDYGRWLAWVRRTDPTALTTSPLERLTRERVKSYVAHLQATVAPRSVPSFLRGLGSVAWAFSESNDYYWIVRYAQRLAYGAVSVRNKRQIMKRTYELVSLGLKLMEGADKKSSDVASAIAFRNGLIIALLAYRPIRRGNLTGIILGEHLVKGEAGYLLRFRAHETKQRKALDVPVPERLTSAIDTYLAAHRPVLARRPPHAGTAGNAFWVAADGGALSQYGIYDVVRKETRKEFGHALNPHFFRDIAATTIALDDPSQIAIVADVLGHSNQVTSARYYNQARCIDASRRFQDHLKDIKRDVRGER